MREKVNLLITSGGLGDTLCYLVAVDYVIKNCPWCEFLIWVPDYLHEFAKNVLPSNTFVKNFTQGAEEYDNTLAGVTTRWNDNHSPIRTSPVDFAFHVLADVHIYDDSKKNYLKLNTKPISIKKYNLPEKYVALQAYATETVKRLPGHVINSIAKYVKEKGYTPVFIGSGKAHVGVKDKVIISSLSQDLDFSLGINLTNKTTLLETGKIIDQSKAFIGMDGGLLHVAGFTSAPIIAGFSFVSPEHILPIRNNIKGWNCFPVLPTSDCKFCQTNGMFIYEKDFRKCIYNKDYECLKSLTFEKYKEQIDLVLK